MRLTLSCSRASRLPASIESDRQHGEERPCRRVRLHDGGARYRSSSANTAPLETVATKAVTGAGAPW